MDVQCFFLWKKKAEICPKTGPGMCIPVSSWVLTKLYHILYIHGKSTDIYYDIYIYVIYI